MDEHTEALGRIPVVNQHAAGLRSATLCWTRFDRGHSSSGPAYLGRGGPFGVWFVNTRIWPNSAVPRYLYRFRALPGTQVGIARGVWVGCQCLPSYWKAIPVTISSIRTARTQVPKHPSAPERPSTPAPKHPSTQAPAPDLRLSMPT